MAPVGAPIGGTLPPPNRPPAPPAAYGGGPIPRPMSQPPQKRPNDPRSGMQKQ